MGKGVVRGNAYGMRENEGQKQLNDKPPPPSLSIGRAPAREEIPCITDTQCKLKFAECLP